MLASSSQNAQFLIKMSHEYYFLCRYYRKQHFWPFLIDWLNKKMHLASMASVLRKFLFISQKVSLFEKNCAEFQIL